MKTVTQSSDYYKRLLGKLNEQETRIERLQTETADLQERLNAQQKELEDYLANLDVG